MFGRATARPMTKTPPRRHATSGRWIRAFGRGEAATHRLICLPHAGGGSSYFSSLSATLEPDVEVLAIQYPGHLERLGEPLVDDLRRLSGAISSLDAVAKSPVPLSILGHSMGATLAFEVARQLQQNDFAVQSVFVSGRRSPADPHRDEPVSTKSNADLLLEVAKLQGFSSELLADAEFMGLVIPILRNDYRAVEKYHYLPGPPLATPLVAMFGTEDADLNRASMDRWHAFTSESFEVHEFPGGHFYLESNNDEIAGLIRNTAMRDRSGPPTTAL